MCYQPESILLLGINQLNEISFPAHNDRQTLPVMCYQPESILLLGINQLNESHFQPKMTCKHCPSCANNERLQLMTGKHFITLTLIYLGETCSFHIDSNLRKRNVVNKILCFHLYPYSCVFSCATVKQRNDTLGNPRGVENKILCLTCIHIHVSSRVQPLNKEMIL